MFTFPVLALKMLKMFKKVRKNKVPGKDDYFLRDT